VHQQWRADGSAGDDVLHRPVRRVVPPHEADLDQPAPTATSASRIRRQASCDVANGLLAEDRLARSQAGQHVLLVGRTPGRHDDRVHVRCVDQCLPVRMDDRARQVGTAAAALTGSTSVTATTSAPARTLLSRSTWSRPIIPVPTTPTRTVISR
jgi:hypothetical protein